MKVDVAIIGAGPAGAVAAIQLKRAGKKVALFERDKIGGLLHSASLIENYAGFPDGISGIELAGKISKQLNRLEVETYGEEVIGVSFSAGSFQIKTDSQRLEVKYLIAASGTKPKKIPIKLPSSCEKLVHSEITNLLQLKDKKTAIVGGGDAAFDYGLNLAEYNKVTLLIRSKPSCLPLLYNRARKNNSIDIIYGVDLVGIEERNNTLDLRLKKDNESQKFNADHLLFAIGREPNIDFLKSLTDIDKLTKEKRLFLAGDVKNGLFRQISIAVGDGVRTAMEIITGKCNG